MSRLVALLLYLLLIIVSLATAAYGVANYLTLTRGIEPDLPAQARLLGTNVALDRYTTDADLDRALAAAKAAGLTVLRQQFAWREIEPAPGSYDWAKWDRLVQHATAANVQLLAVLDTAPSWAQRDYERDVPTAPPANFEDFARFAAAFAARYADSINYYQIWDEPNVHPNWGRRNADPVEYAQLLIPAAQAIRANDNGAKILLAGLAMNLETERPHPDYSEILFLRGLYQIGAQKYFDIVSAKPYGMWTGPEDRRVSSDVLNFSRVILLRDEMKSYGDGRKPIWAVEEGWNALPAGWQGAPSPWGSDTESVQADRLSRALARAQSEWNWMGAQFPQTLQPSLPPDDPRRGFAILAPDFSPRPFYNAIHQFSESSPLPERLPPPPWLPVLVLVGVAVISGWRAALLARQLRASEYWDRLDSRFNSLPALVQFAVLALIAGAFYVSPGVALNFILLALLVILFALRLDFALALTVFSIPFWNYPKVLVGGAQFSPVELFTWVCAAAWFLRTALTDVLDKQVSTQSPSSHLRRRLTMIFKGLSSLDWAVLALLVLGFISTRIASNFGVANREFRVMVFDPALFYALVRATQLTIPQSRRLIYALLLSGTAVCVIGLWQFARGDVIAADGVNRIYAVWGSPNNVALFLGRLFPLAFVFALLLTGRARWVFAALAALFGLTIYLTYSRGTLLLGIPASILFILLVLVTKSGLRSRTTRIVLVVVAVIAVVALLPVASTARFQSLFQSGTGTGFFRVAVWTSALQMIRDHPFWGVGLDNFLYEYPKYILPEAWREPNLSHPHNLILDFWVSLGILGVAVLVWMLIEFFRRAWRLFTLPAAASSSESVWVRALALGLMASMVDFIAHGMIDSAYFVIDLAYVFILSLALVAGLTADNIPLTEEKQL